MNIINVTKISEDLMETNHIKETKDCDHFTDCMICGAELIYSETSSLETCYICGKKSMTNALCSQGHYICDGCHSYSSYAPIYAYLRESLEKDPIKLFEDVIRMPKVHMHGPEHHFIIPLVLLTAFRNCGGKLNYDSSMLEAYKRASQAPGGICGNWGVCGAAAGAGIYASIILGSNPLNKEVWPVPQKLASDILARLSGIGGPRCCKRTGRVAIQMAAKFTSQLCGVEIKTGHASCGYFLRNRECIKEDCPYYP